MKKFILLIPIFLYSETFEDIIKKINSSPAIKSAVYLQKSAANLYKSQKGRNLPSIDASINAIRLKDTPVIYFHSKFMPASKFQVGKKSKFQGEIALKYPIFSGFAIEALINKAKWQKEEADLKVKDLKRNLYLKAASLFSSAISLNYSLKALKEAKKAINEAYKKAKGLYENGLIPPSYLYNIKAQTYDIEAKIIEAKSQKEELLNYLSYLTDSKIASLEFKQNDIKLPKRETLIRKALKQREDIKALKKALEIDKEEIKLAKSSLYPKVALIGALKREGDSLRLNGDGYTNPDKSYIGASISLNLFNGFSDKYKIEAARMKKLSKEEFLKDYENQVKTNIKNAYLKLSSLKAKLKSQKAKVKAKEEYYKLTKGRFENKLASADELSRAIASLAKAKAKEGSLKAAIFKEKIEILLFKSSDIKLSNHNF